MKVQCFEDVCIAMEVPSMFKVNIFEATNDPWVKLYVCEGSSPKRGVSLPFLGQKSKEIVFSKFFQYFIVNYNDEIVFYIFSISFGNILHIFSCRFSWKRKN